MTTDLIFNRFRSNSVAGRILVALAAGPKTPEVLAKLAQSKSPDNILAAGGWFYQLRRFGKTSRKFDLRVVDGRLVMKVSPRYRAQVGG